MILLLLAACDPVYSEIETTCREACTLVYPVCDVGLRELGDDYASCLSACAEAEVTHQKESDTWGACVMEWGEAIVAYNEPDLVACYEAMVACGLGPCGPVVTQPSDLTFTCDD